MSKVLSYLVIADWALFRSFFKNVLIAMDGAALLLTISATVLIMGGSVGRKITFDETKSRAVVLSTNANPAPASTIRQRDSWVLA